MDVWKTTLSETENENVSEPFNTDFSSLLYIILLLSFIFIFLFQILFLIELLLVSQTLL